MNIEARFIIKERAKLDLESKVKGLRSFVNDYVYERMGSFVNNYINRSTRNTIYNSVRFRTGGLGKSLTPIIRKVNQYSSDYGFYFDDTKAKYVGTHVGLGTQHIGRQNREWLTIPVNRLADRYNPRPRVPMFKGRLQFIKISPEKAIWVWRNVKNPTGKPATPKGQGKRQRKNRVKNPSDIAFVGVQTIRVKRRIDPNILQEEFSNAMSERVNNLTAKAVENFFRKGVGGWY